MSMKVEIAFDLSANGQGNFLTLDDSVKGQLDSTTYVLAGETLVDITDKVRRLSSQRGRSRVLEQFTAGVCTIDLSNQTGSVGFYGSSGATYGTTVYGTKLVKQFQTQVIGSGFSVSLQFVSDSQDPPFSLDAATLEYALHDRR